MGDIFLPKKDKTNPGPQEVFFFFGRPATMNYPQFRSYFPPAFSNLA